MAFDPTATSTNAAAFRDEWKRAIYLVMGSHPAHELLAGLSKQEKGAGVNYFITGSDVANSDEAEVMDPQHEATLRKFHEAASGDQSFAAWLQTRTVNMQTLKIATLSNAQTIKWGTSWSIEEDGDWIAVVDPKSSDMDACARKICKKRDILFGKAVIAASTQRKLGAASLAVVPLPSSQVIGDLKYAEVTVDSLAAVIREKAGNAYSAGMPIYCAVSTTVARHLKANSSTLVRSRDFIASYEQFKKGDLPTIEGITFIEMPKSYMEAVKPNNGSSGSVTSIADATGDGVDITLDAGYGDIMVGDTITVTGCTVTAYNAAHVVTDIMSAGVFNCSATTYTSAGSDGSWAVDATVIDHYFAWTPQAIANVTYVPLKSNIAPDPGANFEEVALVKELKDYVRTQDLGVWCGDIIPA